MAYPKDTLQNGVGYVMEGRPGSYPAQALNDEIYTARAKTGTADGTQFKVGTVVVFDTDGYRNTTAADVGAATQYGVVTYSLTLTAQSTDSYWANNELDVNFPIKVKGNVVARVLTSAQATIKKGDYVTIDGATGTVKPATTGNAIGLVDNVYKAYGTADIRLLMKDLGA